MSSPQVAVALDKEAHPERYCASARCLWRTDEDWCPRHRPQELPCACGGPGAAHCPRHVNPHLYARTSGGR